MPRPLLKQTESKSQLSCFNEKITLYVYRSLSLYKTTASFCYFSSSNNMHKYWFPKSEICWPANSHNFVAWHDFYMGIQFSRFNFHFFFENPKIFVAVCLRIQKEMWEWQQNNGCMSKHDKLRWHVTLDRRTWHDVLKLYTNKERNYSCEPTKKQWRKRSQNKTRKYDGAANYSASYNAERTIREVLTISHKSQDFFLVILFFF